MATVEKSIDVNVPVSTAYNQWTQFEDFPKFMEGIKEVRQLDETHLRWVAEIAGKTKEWDAEITEQVPDMRIAWRSIAGAPNGGVVTFHRISDDTTRIMLQIEYDPEGIAENVGDAVGVVSRRIQADLERFKEFIETRGQETGAWRGAVEQERPQPGV
ncbi:MAG: SRPBCC family protein [Burkholderiales bacterium]|nr:SRPBCC family protein [Burkholderiales bacterium]